MLLKFSQCSEKTLKKEVTRVRLIFPASASCWSVQAAVPLLSKIAAFLTPVPATTKQQHLSIFVGHSVLKEDCIRRIVHLGRV